MAGSRSKGGGGTASVPPARSASKGRPRVTSFVAQPGAGTTKAGRVSIPVKAQTLRALSGDLTRVGPLVDTYGVALKQSRAIGKPVRFIVEVKPDGRPNIMAVDAASDVTTDAAPGAGDKAGLDQALAAARERGRIRVAEIMERPEMLSADEFAALLGTTRVTVNKWRQNHKVLGLDGATRGYRFPEWQIGGDGKPFAVLPELFDRLGGPWAVYRFLVQQHAELGGVTARDALRRGRNAAVLEAAESVVRAFG
jgi:DNA-binding transcriptional regulator YiaG